MLNNKISKYVIMFMVFFMTFALDVKAAHIVDFSKKGSIEITLEENEENKGIPNAEITIYKIADATSKNNNLVFEYIEELKECTVDLENLEDSNSASEISKCITSDVPKYVELTNELGKVKFTELDLGIYLISQTNTLEKYSTIDSFLAMMPIVEDNSWKYDIKATPKTDVYKVIDITVRKSWNVDKDFNKIPSSVTIELYKGDELIDTVTLGDHNGWIHTWERIEESDSYSVKEINVPDGFTPSYKKNEYLFTVTNTDTLPKTGQIYYPIIIFTITGMMFIFLGFIEQRKGN